MLYHSLKIAAVNISDQYLHSVLNNALIIKLSFDYNDRTIENNKMSKKKIKFLSWLIRCWRRHGDNVERPVTHKSHTAARNTYSISALISNSSTSLYCCHDNTRTMLVRVQLVMRQQKATRAKMTKMVLGRGSHGSGQERRQMVLGKARN